MTVFRALARAAILSASALMFISAVQAADAPAADMPGFSGEVGLGATMATGNSARRSIDVDTKLRNRTPRREDRLKFVGAFARENGSTTAQRFEVAAQSNFDMTSRFYLLGFAQYDDDRFSGFDYESEFGTGAGYRLVRSDKMSFTVDAGPGYRRSKPVLGPTQDKIFLRATALMDYVLSPMVKLSNEASAKYDSERTKLEDTLALTSTPLLWGTGVRLSFNARYNSNPPPAIKKTDTISKVALVYGF